VADKGMITKVNPRAIRKKATQDEYAHNMSLIYTGMVLARQGLIRYASILGRDRDTFLSLLEKVERGIGPDENGNGSCPYILGNLPEKEIDPKQEKKLNWKYPQAKLPFDVGKEVHGSYGFVATWCKVPLAKNDIVEIVKDLWDKKISLGLVQKWYERGKIKRVAGGKGQKGATYDGGSVRKHLEELYGEPTSSRPDKEPWLMPVAFPRYFNEKEKQEDEESFFKKVGLSSEQIGNH